MWNNCNVVIIATNETNKIRLDNHNKLSFEQDIKGLYYDGIEHIYQYLYITSDEELKEGDWFISELNEIWQHNGKITPSKLSKKIIATSDKNLIRNISRHLGVTQELPQIPLSFITEFITEYNKGNVITKVNVEYVLSDSAKATRSVHINSMYGSMFEHKSEEDKTELYDLCNSNKLKVNQSNEITIQTIKDTYSREEVITSIKLAVTDLYSHLSNKEVNGLDELEYNWTDKWIEENL